MGTLARSHSYVTPGRRTAVTGLGMVGHVAQDKHGALAGRQVLHGGDQGEPHAGPGYGDLRGILGPGAPQRIRDGLSVVITMSSGAALRGSPLSGGYAGAKATVRFEADSPARSG